MARSLPENTVDAWTAIDLARARSPWIWLPTTNQGASWIGSHPGDVSSLLGGRLVLIENKGIETESSIDFGSKWLSQRDYLLAVEHAGIAAVATPPPLGWVFYGLPLRSGSTFGSDWQVFPRWQHLACPHKLSMLGIGGSATITNLETTMNGSVMIHTTTAGSVSTVAHALGDLRLSRLALACDLGLAGLPLPTTNEVCFELLRQVIDVARSAWPEALEGDTELQRPPFFNGDAVFELLHELAALAGAWSGHATLAILPDGGQEPEEP